MAMLAVSIITSALTTQLRDHERLRAETEKEKMRANLLRAISHDIRTPLTSIVGSVSVLRENGSKISEETKEELLAHVQEEGQWLITMVENLLSITRISNEGAASISRQPEVLEEVVGGAVQTFRGRHKNIRVMVEFPQEIAIVSMDAILIEQVMINLLENAVNHAAGMTELRLSVSVDKQLATFEVTDNGCGIPRDCLDHLFTGQYYSKDAPSDSNRSGMGIGLSVCSTIIRAHHGTIYAHNNDTGARVSFTLPLEKETA
jgi:two-component system sensor histidine kinase KdpD